MIPLVHFLITLLIFLLVAGVILWVVRLALATFPFTLGPDGKTRPVFNLVYGIVVLLLLLVFLSEVGFLGPARGWRGP